MPRELMLQKEIEDIPVLEEWLTKRRGARVYIRVPKKGQKEKLVELAEKNARMVLEKDRERIAREEARTVGAVRQIAQLLDLPVLERMEAFDISNISGFENVGSMVVYEKGKPKRSDYRKFRIKTVAVSYTHLDVYKRQARSHQSPPSRPSSHLWHVPLKSPHAPLNPAYPR